MTWGAVAGAVGAVAVGALNSRNQPDQVVDRPTRTTGIEELLRELTSTVSEEGLSSESQAVLDQLMQDESFTEELQKSAAESTVGSQVTSELGSQTQDTSSTRTGGTAESQAALSQVLQGGDGQAQVDAIVNQILREGKTDISNVGTRTGSFGSTTEQLLTNDLIARAASAGVGQQNVIDARTLEAINLAQQGNVAESGTVAGTTTSDATTATEQQRILDEITATIGDRTTASTRDTTSDTTQATSGTTDTTSTDEQTAISDTLQNPQDNLTVTGDLAALITGGIGREGRVQDAIDAEGGPGFIGPVNPVSPTVTVGSGSATTPAQLQELDQLNELWGGTPPQEAIDEVNAKHAALANTTTAPTSTPVGSVPETPQPVTTVNVAPPPPPLEFASVAQDLDNVIIGS